MFHFGLKMQNNICTRGKHVRNPVNGKQQSTRHIILSCGVVRAGVPLACYKNSNISCAPCSRFSPVFKLASIWHLKMKMNEAGEGPCPRSFAHTTSPGLVRG